MVTFHSIASFITLLIGCSIVQFPLIQGFQIPPTAKVISRQPSITTTLKNQPNKLHSTNSNNVESSNGQMSRRSMFTTSTFPFLLLPLIQNPIPSHAIVGSLPEYSDSNAVLQGVTIDVADLNQQSDMIDFLKEGFGFKILRQRRLQSITETWMGFGPEEMKIPDNFELPVSSFSQYGGHASICIRYDIQTSNLYYKKGDNNPPGNNIAYIQVGVPAYRISQMVKYGGNILDAYGVVNVVSPSGVPMRGIVGINPDPIMFVALNCKNVKESREFYEQLGFVEQEYPYCRPNKGMGQFEPPQPKNSVYLSPSKNSMGILLLQAEKKIRNKIVPNPAFRSMNIVYTPSEGTVVDDNSGEPLKVLDPTGASISFQSYNAFEKEELSTRLIATE